MIGLNSWEHDDVTMVKYAVSPVEPISASSLSNSSVARRQTVYLILSWAGRKPIDMVDIFGQSLRTVQHAILSAQHAYDTDSVYRDAVNRIMEAK